MGRAARAVGPAVAPGDLAAVVVVVERRVVPVVPAVAPAARPVGVVAVAVAAAPRVRSVAPGAIEPFADETGP